MIALFVKKINENIPYSGMIEKSLRFIDKNPKRGLQATKGLASVGGDQQTISFYHKSTFDPTAESNSI
jgi:hypothetical protein